MNKKELIAALESLDMRPGRGLGQNFLMDANLLDFIVRTSGLAAGEKVLEVGPGFGALTEKLVAAGADVTAIEYDHRLAEYLRKKFPQDSLTLIEKDACKVNYGELFPAGTFFRAIANLPYAISTVFIARILESPSLPQSMLFMLQKEMGERLSAACGSKAYGALSVRCQVCYDVSIARIVPPEVFYPAPEVDSAIVAFKRHDRHPLDPATARTLDRIVKLVFSQRRKQMGKVLSRGGYDASKVAAAFETCGIPLEIRPDRVDVATFCRLGSLLSNKE